MLTRNKNCRYCDLSRTCQWTCLWGVGPSRAKVMLVGEAPGKDEDAEGKPFVGKAGRLLDQMLGDVGLKRSEIYISNAVKCRPPENRTPTRNEINTCRKYLCSEIEEVRPELIVCLGTSAIKAITQDHRLSVTKARASKWKYKGASIRATYHPAAVFRTPYFYKLIQEDFERFFGKPKQTITKRVHDWMHPESLPFYLEEAAKKGVVALDIETNGLDPFRKDARIWSVGFSDMEGISHVIPIHHRGAVNRSPERSLQEIDRIITGNPNVLVVGHNLKFDLKWLRKFGCSVRCKLFDTMVAFHLLDENYPNKTLKHLAILHTDMGDYSKEIRELAKDKEKYPDFQYPFPSLVKYNGDDADATLRLYKVFSENLKQEGLQREMAFNMMVLRTLTEMELVGIKINMTTLYELVREYEKKLRHLNGSILEELPGVNLDSPKQLAVALYKTKGFRAWKFTPHGSPSTDKEALEALKKFQKCKLASEILERRKVTKVLRTYLRGKADQVADDGKIHTTFHLASNREAGEYGEKGGTGTGRLGSDMQQIPKVGGIKSMFVSRWKNGLICQADYSQIELRVMAHFSQDKAMLEAFRTEGADFHRAVAARVFGKKEEDVTPLERSKCKAINFGIIYCIGPQHLSEEIGTSIAEAARFIRDWFDSYLDVERWIRSTEDRVIKTGCVQTLFGRKRRLVGGTRVTPTGRAILRQGVNSPIQGTASELTLFGMSLLHRKIERMGLKSKIMLNVHDAVILDVPKSEKDTVESLIPRIFEHLPIEEYFGVQFTCPLKIEVKFGRTWKECEDYE